MSVSSINAPPNQPRSKARAVTTMAMQTTVARKLKLPPPLPPPTFPNPQPPWATTSTRWPDVIKKKPLGLDQAEGLNAGLSESNSLPKHMICKDSSDRHGDLFPHFGSATPSSSTPRPPHPAMKIGAALAPRPAPPYRDLAVTLPVTAGCYAAVLSTGRAHRTRARTPQKWPFADLIVFKKGIFSARGLTCGFWSPRRQGLQAPSPFGVVRGCFGINTSDAGPVVHRFCG
jgi:hypothetical protein